MIDLQILAVIPKDNDLANKQFKTLDRRELDQIRELIFENGMISKETSTKYFFIINEVL